MKYLIVATGQSRDAILFGDDSFTFQEMAHGHHVLSNGWVSLDPQRRRVSVDGPQSDPVDAELLRRLFFPS